MDLNMNTAAQKTSRIRSNPYIEHLEEENANLKAGIEAWQREYQLMFKALNVVIDSCRSEITRYKKRLGISDEGPVRTLRVTYLRTKAVAQ